jgi:hypothetical protein
MPPTNAKGHTTIKGQRRGWVKPTNNLILIHVLDVCVKKIILLGDADLRDALDFCDFFLEHVLRSLWSLEGS